MKQGAPTVCMHAISGSVSLPFRGSFRLSLTVLVHYRWPGVSAPWRVVPPASHRVSRAPWYSGILTNNPMRRRPLRDSHPLRWAFPDPSRTPHPVAVLLLQRAVSILQPRRHDVSAAPTVWAPARFARHYYGPLPTTPSANGRNGGGQSRNRPLDSASSGY